jgi:hypothetical protein
MLIFWVTFFWNRSWFDVVCQYSSVPSACAAITVFFIVEFGDVLARLITGDLSYFIRVYWIDLFVVDNTLVVPSSHPKQTNPDAGRYSEQTTRESNVIYKSLMK